MAIMQDWPVLNRKIAKMQDGIRLRPAHSDFDSEVSDNLSLTRIRTKFRSGWWRSKCPPPAKGGSGIFRRHRSGNVADILTVTLLKSDTHFAFLILAAMCGRKSSFSQVYYGQNRKNYANGMTAHFKKHDTAPEYTSSDNLSLEAVRILASPLS